MRALLDVDVLLALIDSNHVHHERAHAWRSTLADARWATCAITENGFARIISQTAYPRPMATDDAMGLLDQACADQHHEYWPCDITLRDPRWIDRSQILDHRQLTDIYLLALATAHGGRFVTFDRAITRGAVPSATPENLVVL